MSTGNNDPYISIRIPEFKLYIIQRFFFVMGMRMIGTSVLLKIAHVTDNFLLVSFVGLSEAVPAVLMALYSGHIVDKSDKRTMLFRTIVLYFFCAAGLTVLTMPQVETEIGKQWLTYGIYAFMFCTGVIRSFSGPTSASILAQLVPKNILPNAVTWSSSTWLTASVIGHASAGFLIVFTGYTGTFIVIMIYLLISATVMFQIGHKPVMNTKTDQKTWESVKVGLRYVLRTKELLGALSLDMFAVLFGGVVAMIPFFTKDILKVSPIGFGFLNAAADVGALISIWTLTFRPLRGKQGLVLMYVVAGFGLSIIAFGLSTWYWLSLVALLASGVLDGISVVIRGTILQLKTPDEMRGRVSSVNSMFINSSNEIGNVESGIAATLMGLVPSVVFGGAMTLLVVVVMWFKAPTLRKFEY